MSRLSPMVLAAILLVSMLFIFWIPAAGNPIVGLVALIIFVVGLFLAFSNGSRDQREESHRMLSILTSIAALSSAALVGQVVTRGNLVGFLCGPVLLAVSYVAFITLVSRMGISVEEGELLLSQRRMDHQHIIRPPGLHQRMIAGLEAGIAIMPTYNIQTEVIVQEVDTHGLFKVERIVVDILARIIQHFPRQNEQLPVELRYEGFLRLPYHYPNRDRVFKEMADEIGISPAEARMSPDFWIKAIQRQIAHDADEELRAVIHNQRFNLNDGKVDYLAPTDISEYRQEIAAVLKQRLQKEVQHWGIEILDVSMTQVLLHPQSVELYHKEKMIEIEERDAERRAQIEARQRRIMAEAEHEILQQQFELQEAHQQKQIQSELAALRQRHNVDSLAVLQMINEFMDSMQKYNADVDAADIQRLLLLALEEHKRLGYAPATGHHGSQIKVGGSDTAASAQS